MNRIKIKPISLILFFMIISPCLWAGGSSSWGTLSELDASNNSIVDINLRLRNYDRVFQKLVFYDSRNIDIIFDISDDKLRESLAGDLINIHEGMIYAVKMRVLGKGSLGGIIAKIIQFKPVMGKYIP